MLVSEVVQKSVIPISPSTLLTDVLIENYPENILYLPVVEGDHFVGFLSLIDLELERELNETVGQCSLDTTELFASPGQHLFEVLVLFQKAALPVLPVLGEHSAFQGIISLDQLLHTLAGSHAFQAEGAVLVLSVETIQYSLSEISRLVESNQGKILTVLVESDPFTHERILVHLKINLTDLSRVVATLERFDYQVVELHHKSEMTSLDQERLDQLMKYLGI